MAKEFRTALLEEMCHSISSALSSANVQKYELGVTEKNAPLDLPAFPSKSPTWMTVEKLKEASEKITLIFEDVNVADTNYGERINELNSELEQYAVIARNLSNSIGFGGEVNGRSFWESADLVFMQTLEMNGLDKTTIESLKEMHQFKKILQDEYGFDRRTASSLWKTKMAIDEKCREEGLTQLEADWMYCRIMGGLFYNSDAEKSSVFFISDETVGNEYAEQWNKLAGVFDEKIKSTQDYKNYLVNELGLSKTECEYMAYQVRLQHELSGNYTNYDINGNPQAFEENFEKNKEYWKANAKKALGIDLSDEEIKEYIIGKTETMLGKGDYAHVMITTSAYIADNIGGKVKDTGSSAFPAIVSGFGWENDYTRWGWNTNEEREALSGWLGDAILYSPGSGNGPSFEKDDFKSNLDSSNIAHLMESKGYTLNQATAEYYRQIESGETTRTEMFLANEGPLENIKEMIEKNTVPARTIDELPEDEYSDTLAFLNILERAENGTHSNAMK